MTLVEVRERLFGTPLFVGRVDVVPQCGDYLDFRDTRYRVANRYFDMDKPALFIMVDKV